MSETIIKELKHVLMRPVAPWIMRIMYINGGVPYTRDEMIGAMHQLITRNKGLTSLFKYAERMDDEVDEAYCFLVDHELVEPCEGRYSLTPCGKILGEEITPRVSNIYIDRKN